MIRRASFHVVMARLALVAALLLAAVPTLGRLAPQVMWLAHGAHAELVALCTADGLRYVEIGADAHHGDGQHVAERSVVERHAHGQHAHDRRAHEHNATANRHASGHSDAPSQAPHEHGGPDCAYCPLLLSLLVAAAWLLWLRAATARVVLPSWPASTPRAFIHPCGLGSRGPPRADACLRA